MRNIIRGIIYTGIALNICSCESFVEVPPPVATQTAASVFSSDASATGFLTGIYMSLCEEGFGSPGTGVRSVGTVAGLSADELTVEGTLGANNPELSAYASNDLTSRSSNAWTPMYNSIYRANLAIENLNDNKALSPAIRQQLLGEAFFIRAFHYFYLVNLYGEVPLAITTDYEVNMMLSRAPADAVYAQIIEDLLKAEDLLSTEYLSGNLLSVVNDRLRPTKAAASTLLARAYLYRKEYVNAERHASLVIDNKAMYDTVPLNDVFLVNSKESIWQLPMLDQNYMNAAEGPAFIVDSVRNNINGPNFSPTARLLNSFEAGDRRRQEWFSSGKILLGDVFVFPFKYKLGAGSDLPKREQSVVLRLAEVYLIRAEARLQQDNIAGAKQDLDVIRKRAGLPNTTASTASALQLAIEQERRAELFTEWGHRFLDLKRWGKANAVLGAIKTGWETTDQFYPLPQTEINRGPNLRQNPGY